ncbi:MAG: hypothetical protein Kow0075_03090 [Salibacteraceae bacterium]
MPLGRVFAQDVINIVGYATTQTIEEEMHSPAADVIISVYDDEGLFLEEKTSLSGSFYFQLPVGTDYFVEWKKPGYTTKRILFDLNGVDPGEIKRNKSTFEFDVVLVETEFLNKELRAEGQINRVYWDEKAKELTFQQDELNNYWEKFETLQEKYNVAKRAVKKDKMTKVLSKLKEEMEWPEDIGEALDLAIVEDYDLYLKLKLEQKRNEEMDDYKIDLLEGERDLKKLKENKYDAAVIPRESGIEPEKLEEVVGDKTLLITKDYETSNSMINFVSTGSDTRVEMNDIALVAKGYAPSAELRKEAELNTDKTAVASMIAESQKTIIQAKKEATQLESEKRSLQVLNQGVFRSKAKQDSVLRITQLQIKALEDNIKMKSARLQELNMQMQLKNQKLAETQRIFEEKRKNLDKTLEELAAKEKKLMEFNRLLEQTNRAIETQRKELAQSMQLLQDQKKLNMAIAGVAGLILLLLIIAVRNYREQKRLAIENMNQAERIKAQSELLRIKNTELSDSINYAKRIQDSILPNGVDLAEMVKEMFIYYAPKDIVAGDFFWIKRHNDSVYFAVADCTGHGVPGAMVSVVCSNALDRAFREIPGTSPASLLDLTRKYVIDQIAQGSENVKDGMDIALCKWTPSTRVLEFSGAHNPLWIVTKDRDINQDDVDTRPVQTDGFVVYEIKGDKQPVGAYDVINPFENHRITLHENDCLYIFSDGYADQFGGKRGKKMKYSVFREILALSAELSLEEQKDFIEEYFLNWRGDIEQIDDVCVMGVRV